VWDEGDVAIPADDRCSKTTYAQNTAAWVLDAESRVEEVRVGCGTTPSYPRDAVNDVKTTFDSREPGRALPVLIEKVQSYAGTTPNYIEEKKATFDVYGRELDVFDPLNRKTTTRFEPETGLARHVVVTNPLGHQVKTTNNLSWGQPELTVDMNGRRTELAYDAFGRLAEVWKPGRSKDAGDSGNLIYRYSLNRDKASSVETETLTASGSHVRSFDLFDGFLRARQTQKQAWGGGRIVTDEQYDSRGLAVRKNSPYFSTGEPESGLVKAADNEVPGQTVIEHDGAERETKSTFVSHNQPKHETLTRHWGDHTDVIPPLGDTTKSTYVDVRGKTTELRQFKGREPVGEFDSTKYTYTETGEQESTTDALGNKL
ncbi:type IV secretion protein Rhs, partial [Amycolatopsis lurida]